MEKESKIVVPSKDEIVRIHNYLVGAHGGIMGIRQDPSYVSEFCKHYLAETGIVPVVGFMLSRLSKGHYFTDGNKRTAYFTGRYTALKNRYDFDGTSPDEFVSEMDEIVKLDDDKSRKYAEELVERDLLQTNFSLEDYFDFERLVLKSIAVSNKLA